MRYARIFIICFVFLSVLCCSAFADDVDTPDPGSESITLLTVSADPQSGSLKDVLLSFIGDYEPIVEDYTYTSYSGSVQHNITVTPDWCWICSAACLMLFCFIVFKTIGCVFRGVL